MSNIAVINYYARLIKKGIRTMDDVNEEDREAVKEALDKLPDPVFDPVTQTPAEE